VCAGVSATVLASGAVVARNREKARVYNRRWAAENPERRKEINIEAQLRRYGLTRANYNQMLIRHHGLCAICARPETAKRKGTLRSLCVDHDHATGRVRGLLCCSCNRAVGYLGDDPARARALSVYLETS
jgi:hypothetical protein